MIMKILGKIRELANLKKERNQLKEIARKQSLLLQRIKDVCVEYQQLNCSLGYAGFRKIQTIAATDLNKKYNNDFLQDDNDFEIIGEYNGCDH